MFFLLPFLFSGAIASSYAPIAVNCPASLVRVATGLSEDEAAFRTARKSLADDSLRSWLASTGFQTTGELPTLGLSISGGGYRAFLTGAGVIQALDSNDSNVSTSGLYQAITYHSALSGGSWLLSSLADHNYPTISSLFSSQWSSALSNGLLAPNGILAILAYAGILNDIKTKESAGFASTLLDIWARLLGYQFLSGSDGGAASTLSGIQSKPNFISHNVPYPIIATLNADLTTGYCVPKWNASVWELTPFEFGSWGGNINAFSTTKYLGSSISNGTGSSCYTGYDNLGFATGTSSNVFNDVGALIPSLASTLDTFCTASVGTATDSFLGEAISALLTIFPSLTEDLEEAVDAVYALYPNPFYKLGSAPQVSSLKTLHMVDGGESGQPGPIFPHLQPARNVSLVIVNDNNGDTDSSLSYPNGTSIHNSYLAAVSAGLTRMPFIPSPASYLTNFTSGNPIFFGCRNPDVVTLVWMPNADYTYPSGIGTFALSYSSETSGSMIANGKAMMSRNDSDEWAVCLACAILDAGGLDVPSSCSACFEEYCYSD